jgi:hypothetical protein
LLTTPSSLCRSATARSAWPSAKASDAKTVGGLAIEAQHEIANRLGGDPRKIAPPKGNARPTFDPLAQRHACYMGKLTEHAQERLRQKMSKRPWPTDPTELRTLREACGLPKSY